MAAGASWWSGAGASGRCPDGLEVERQMRILIVDDDPFIVELLRTTLTAKGREVLVASTIAEARSVVASGPIDLIILDRLLPDGDGLAFCREITGAPGVAGAAVILLTGAQTRTDESLALAAGAASFLTKPFSPSRLLD